MSTYSKTKLVSKLMIGLSALAIVISGVGFLIAQNQVGADESSSSCTVPMFKQTDVRWKDIPYGYSDEAGRKPTDVGAAGCGPTSAAMVIRTYYGPKTWNGKRVDPSITAPLCLNGGHRTNGSGTDPSCFSYLSLKFGLKYREVNSGEAKSLLIQAKPVIMGVNSCANKRYTSGGHYIVLTKIVNGTVYINDPNLNNTQDSVANIFGSCYASGFYYIYP